MRTVLMIAALCVACSTSATALTSDRLPPVDEAPMDRELLLTRRAVVDKLRVRDFEGLLAFLADDVTVFGDGEHGQRSLRAIIDAGTGHRGLAVVDELLMALSLGGSFTTTRGRVRGEREFCAPYVYSAFPKEYSRLEREDEPWAIIGKGVAVRRRPGTESGVVARLSYDLVYVTREGLNEDRQGLRWYFVETTTGIKGYVHPSLVRDPADVHACFGRRNDRWLITVIGDHDFPSD